MTIVRVRKVRNSEKCGGENPLLRVAHRLGSSIIKTVSPKKTKKNPLLPDPEPPIPTKAEQPLPESPVERVARFERLAASNREFHAAAEKLLGKQPIPTKAEQPLPESAVERVAAANRTLRTEVENLQVTPPEGWVKLQDPASGQPYYANAQTGTSQWEFPSVPSAPAHKPNVQSTAQAQRPKASVEPDLQGDLERAYKESKSEKTVRDLKKELDELDAQIDALQTKKIENGRQHKLLQRYGTTNPDKVFVELLTNASDSKVGPNEFISRLSTFDECWDGNWGVMNNDKSKQNVKMHDRISMWMQVYDPSHTKEFIINDLKFHYSNRSGEVDEPAFSGDLMNELPTYEEMMRTNRESLVKQATDAETERLRRKFDRLPQVESSLVMLADAITDDKFRSEMYFIDVGGRRRKNGEQSKNGSPYRFQPAVYPRQN
jgi:hypothetical protein